MSLILLHPRDVQSFASLQRRRSNGCATSLKKGNKHSFFVDSRDGKVDSVTPVQRDCAFELSPFQRRDTSFLLSKRRASPAKRISREDWAESSARVQLPFDAFSDVRVQGGQRINALRHPGLSLLLCFVIDHRSSSRLFHHFCNNPTRGRGDYSYRAIERILSL